MHYHCITFHHQPICIFQYLLSNGRIVHNKHSFENSFHFGHSWADEYLRKLPAISIRKGISSSGRFIIAIASSLENEYSLFILSDNIFRIVSAVIIELIVKSFPKMYITKHFCFNFLSFNDVRLKRYLPLTSLNVAWQVLIVNVFWHTKVNNL